MERSIAPVRFIGLILVLTLAAFGLMPMAPAAAAIPGLQRVKTTSPFNSAGNPKAASASCPAGKKVIGMGGFVTNGNGEVVLNEILPDLALGKVRVAAWEDETGYTGNWSVTAIAMCADPLPGLQRIQAQTPTNSSDKDLVVTCPSGQTSLGFGTRVSGSEGQVFLDSLSPFANVSGYVRASEDESGAVGNWSITAVAICADSVPGLISPANWSVGDSTSPKSVDAICPAGTVAITAGGLISSGIDHYGRNEVMLDAFNLPAALDRGGARAVEDASGASFDWYAVSMPLCANP